MLLLSTQPEPVTVIGSNPSIATAVPVEVMISVCDAPAAAS